MRFEERVRIVNRYKEWLNEKPIVLDSPQTMLAFLDINGYLNEVVRCKDCAWYVVNELKADGTTDNRYSPSLCEYLEFYTDKNDYCSFAERKKENEK